MYRHSEISGSSINKFGFGKKPAKQAAIPNSTAEWAAYSAPHYSKEIVSHNFGEVL
jgi:hypothetical protein